MDYEKKYTQEITVELFDNGISFVVREEDSEINGIVAKDDEKEQVIGQHFLREIDTVVKNTLCNKVKITVTYEAV